jgi:acetyl esterase/lipase
LDDGVTVTKDVAYLELDGHEYLVDVYVPDGDGPWPVVVALHGGMVYKSNSHTTVVAQAAAEAGMLVFVPNYVAQWPSLSAMDAEFVQSIKLALPCALAFVQQEAAGYGGDSNRTVVYGMSAGASTGAHLVLGSTRDLTSGCQAQTVPMAPVGAVLGDAEYFLHAPWWDGAFDKDIEEMQTTVAETVDPAVWTTDLPKRIRVWAAADGSFLRSFDDPWDDDGWFAQRDPDSTIREDLDELGELEDGVITYIDEGLLLTHRLQQAGIDTTFDILPGGHTAPDKVPEIVAFLLDAAGTD